MNSPRQRSDGRLVLRREHVSILRTTLEGCRKSIDAPIDVADLFLIAGSRLVKNELIRVSRATACILTSAHAVKNNSPLAALFSGGKASDDCTMPSRTRRSASLAIVP